MKTPVVMVNRVVNGEYIVCVEGTRVRVLDEVPEEPIVFDGFFVPGVLLKSKQSVPFLSALEVESHN